MSTDLLSLGKLCVILQLDAHRVRLALAACGIEPQLRIDDVPHYGAAALDALKAHLKTRSVNPRKRRERAWLAH